MTDLTIFTEKTSITESFPSVREVLDNPDLIMAFEKYVLEGAMSKKTMRCYLSDFNHFREWCKVNDVAVMDAPPTAIAMYLESEAIRGMRMSTLVRKRAGIRFFYALAKLDSPTERLLVSKMLEKIGKDFGSKKTQKSPMTFEIIKQMLTHCDDTPMGIRDALVLKLCYLAALRRSNLVMLNVEDISYEDEGIFVYIERSKTDKMGQGKYIPVLDGELKIKEAIAKWLAVAEITSGKIFWQVTKMGKVLKNKPLRDQAVSLIVKKYIRKIGLDPEKYSGHSPRAGFVTSALDAGEDAFKIMNVTTHTSMEMIRVYDRRVNGLKNHPGKKIS